MQIHQRRHVIEAVKARATFVAACNPEKAADAAKAYLELAVPDDQTAIAEADAAKQRLLDDMAKMAPISMRDVSFAPKPR